MWFMPQDKADEFAEAYKSPAHYTSSPIMEKRINQEKGMRPQWLHAIRGCMTERKVYWQVQKDS
jgi:hypothetical protein